MKQQRDLECGRGVVILLTTFANREQARDVVEAMVGRKLVACGSIWGGVESVYWWEGEICRGEEAMVMMKTLEGKEDEAVAALEELHPYDVPEILVKAVDRVGEGYGSWLEEVLGGRGRPLE